MDVRLVLDNLQEDRSPWTELMNNATAEADRGRNPTHRLSA